MMERLKIWTDKNLKGDPYIWAIIFMLSFISILVVYSAIGSLAYKKMGGNTEHYLFKHTLLVLVSIACMWVAHNINYKYYSRLSRYALWVSIPLLFYGYFFGENLNAASRWIIIPVINQSFQPSDFAKLALIANLASMLAKRQANIDDFKESFVPVVLWSVAICGLIALSNFSTAVILFGTCLLLMFIGRVPLKYLMMLLIGGMFSLTIALAAGQRLATAISRVMVFMFGEAPFQAQQSFMAIAGGGIFGQGPGQSVQGDFLPHGYSDFIYSILIEEYGMIGGIVVLFLYLAFLYRGLQTVVRSERAFGGLLSAGLSFSLVIQAMINMGVSVGLGPITGQPLPLLSMGGTSLIFTGLSLGIILSVSRGDMDESSIYEGKNAIREQAA
jgi:cell division protein FtsW